jgi:hypothetical protein
MPSHSDGAMIQYHRKAIHVHSHIFIASINTHFLSSAVSTANHGGTLYKKNKKVSRNTLNTGNYLNIYFTHLLFLNKYQREIDIIISQGLGAHIVQGYTHPALIQN